MVIEERGAVDPLDDGPIVLPDTETSSRPRGSSQSSGVAAFEAFVRSPPNTTSSPGSTIASQPATSRSFIVATSSNGRSPWLTVLP